MNNAYSTDECFHVHITGWQPEPGDCPRCDAIRAAWADAKTAGR